MAKKATKQAPAKARAKAKGAGKAPTVWAATRKGLFRVVKGAGGWKIADVHFLGDPVTVLGLDRRDGSLYAAAGHEHFGVKVHRSEDGGKTWPEVASPAYPPRPADATDVDYFTKLPIEWKLRAIWAFAAGGTDQPGRVWAGTMPGGLFKSDDRGASWSLVRSLWDNPSRSKWGPAGGAGHTGMHSICVDPRDSRHVQIAVSSGGVWETRDDGKTWDARCKGLRAEYVPPEQASEPESQDPHQMVQCPTAPDHLWIQHHNGIFRTTDGAKTWTEIKTASPSVFGFAVAVHPREPATAWFVPAVKDMTRIPVDGKVVVSITRDGGKTFKVLRKGLPQEHAYDLTYRHGLDIDPSGDRLAFGTTTGGLWITENQGESWAEVSSHLPPVYCVRFGA